LLRIRPTVKAGSIVYAQDQIYIAVDLTQNVHRQIGGCTRVYVRAEVESKGLLQFWMRLNLPCSFCIILTKKQVVAIVNLVFLHRFDALGVELVDYIRGSQDELSAGAQFGDGGLANNRLPETLILIIEDGVYFRLSGHDEQRFLLYRLHIVKLLGDYSDLGRHRVVITNVVSCDQSREGVVDREDVTCEVHQKCEQVVIQC